MIKHTLTLKNLLENDKIATDDWKATEYDMLHDLEFELDGLFEMNFEHEYIIDGDEKYLSMKVYKNKDKTWTLEIKNNKEKPGVKRIYKSFNKMMEIIHGIFNKF